VLAGHVDGFFGGIPGVLPFITSRKLKPIGIAAAQRHPLLPEIKTLQEMGLAGVDSDNWYALFAAKSTPARVADAMNQAVSRVLARGLFRRASTLSLCGGDGSRDRLAGGNLALVRHRAHARSCRSAGLRATRSVNRGGGPLSLACHDLVRKDVLGSPPWLAVRATAWSDIARPHFTNARAPCSGWLQALVEDHAWRAPAPGAIEKNKERWTDDSNS
jgi:hypothetical protein